MMKMADRDRQGVSRVVRRGQSLHFQENLYHFVHLPFLERQELAAVYRRAALLLLPSDREGFGLPVVEAMACGTPVIASAVFSLIEVGGSAVTHCPPKDLGCWVSSAVRLLAEKQQAPVEWETRRRRSLEAAAPFDWGVYAAEMTRLYQEVHAS